jgi:hypothetical protein
MRGRLPTAREINPDRSLDGKVAEKHFLGKTLDEAEALFRENSLYYQEDLLWMGPVAFCYYLRAAVSYVKSPHAEGDADIVSCLAGTLELRLEGDGLALRRALDTMEELCQHVLASYGRFEVDEDIYGDLLTRYHRLLERVDALTAFPPDPPAERR